MKGDDQSRQGRKKKEGEGERGEQYYVSSLGPL